MFQSGGRRTAHQRPKAEHKWCRGHYAETGSSKVCTLQLDIGRGWSLSDNTTSGQEILCLIAFKLSLIHI